VKKYATVATTTMSACERLAAEHPLASRAERRKEAAERARLERLIVELEQHERNGRVKRFFDAADGNPRPREAPKSSDVAALRDRVDAIVSRNQEKRVLLVRYRDDPEIQRLEAEERALGREADVLDPLLRQAKEDAERYAPRRVYSYATGGTTHLDGAPELYERARRRIEELESVRRRVDARRPGVRARREERTAELGL
jgi:hypothetical protein